MDVTNETRQVFDEYSVSEDGAPVYAFSKLMLPYMPYFSNCRGFDSHIPVYALLESTQCTLPDDQDSDWWRYAVVVENPHVFGTISRLSGV